MIKEIRAVVADMLPYARTHQADGMRQSDLACEWLLARIDTMRQTMERMRAEDARLRELLRETYAPELEAEMNEARQR